MAPKKENKMEKPNTSVMVLTDKDKQQEQLRLTMAKIDEKLSELDGSKTG